MPLALILAALSLALAVLIGTTPLMTIILYFLILFWGCMIGAGLLAYYSNRCFCSQKDSDV